MILVVAGTACSSTLYRRLDLELTESFFDFRASVDEGALHQVASLDLRNCDGHLGNRGWGPDVATLLATRSDAEHLERLDLSCHSLEDVGFEALATSPHLVRLEELVVEGNDIEAGLEALSRAQSLSALHTLRVGTNPLRSGSLQILAQSDALPALTTLDLRSSGSSALVSALVGTPMLDKLETLTLSWSTAVTDHTLRLLAQASELTTLRELMLDGTEIRSEGLSELVRSPYTRGLERLDVRDTRVSDEGIAALARSPYMRNLIYLDVRGIALGSTAIDALVATEHLNPHLILRMDAKSLSREQLRSLRERFDNIDAQRAE